MSQIETPAPETFTQATLDNDGLVRGLSLSNILQEGAVPIDSALYIALVPLIGRARLVGGEIVLDQEALTSPFISDHSDV